MRLQHFAVLRRGYREAQGATRSTHDSVQLLVDGRQIKMKHSAEKSRDLIAECAFFDGFFLLCTPANSFFLFFSSKDMILGGSLAAEFASMKKVPIPFRAQLSARVVAAPANAALVRALILSHLVICCTFAWVSPPSLLSFSRHLSVGVHAFALQCHGVASLVSRSATIHTGDVAHSPLRRPARAPATQVCSSTYAMQKKKKKI